MKLTEIQELIKFVVKSGASEVTYEIKGLKLTVKTQGKNGDQQQIIMHTPVQVAAPVSASSGKKTPVTKVPTSAADDSKYLTIKSPMIGTFYRSSSPDKPAFANVGDEIKKGQTICIIEAMKLFNEIESEFTGKIIKVLVDDSTPVEYDQPLFLVEPK
ncbi:MAG: acetyl-CoA carboxylase biotin carboxyl carrier protein [Bacteroidetes bacterium]|nr:MAG: acetyl-CoA carboxylase biotin carboxyl carrier protein [Bacteroidota bacterium]